MYIPLMRGKCGLVKNELNQKHLDKLLMLDREEALKINNLLTKSKLDKELELDGVV